jgi:hypothetical protein
MKQRLIEDSEIIELENQSQKEQKRAVSCTNELILAR